jgi:hypothetical protein
VGWVPNDHVPSFGWGDPTETIRLIDCDSASQLVELGSFTSRLYGDTVDISKHKLTAEARGEKRIPDISRAGAKFEKPSASFRSHFSENAVIVLAKIAPPPI